MTIQQDKWIEALKSGDYTQTKLNLRDTEGFCCLGVACDLFIKETGVGRWGDPTSEGIIPFFYPVPEEESWGENLKEVEVDETSELPDIVREWIGMRSNDGSYFKDTGLLNYDCLAANNDGGLTFEEIATIAESRPMDLFVDV